MCEVVLDRADVLGQEPLRTPLDLELHELPFLQAAEALRLYCRLVAEDVLASVILLDEAEALRVVEPLHCSLSHLRSAFCIPPGNERSGGLRPPGRQQAARTLTRRLRQQLSLFGPAPTGRVISEALPVDVPKPPVLLRRSPAARR